MKNDKVAQVDENIKIHKRSLDLKNHRNPITPICRLPDELLVLVIRNLQFKKTLSGKVDEAFFDFDDHDFRWIRITWLCKHIHDVAVSLDKGTHWNKLALSRSKRSALIINALEQGNNRFVRASPTLEFLEAGHARVKFGGGFWRPPQFQVQPLE
jgi:hypothetical protein